jgi:hypothetical protein
MHFVPLSRATICELTRSNEYFPLQPSVPYLKCYFQVILAILKIKEQMTAGDYEKIDGNINKIGKFVENIKPLKIDQQDLLKLISDVVDECITNNNLKISPTLKEMVKLLSSYMKLCLSVMQ